jgi:LPS export ABC transporter permease LptF
MRILRTYILKELLTVFTFSFLIINIFFLGGSLYKISDMIIRKGIPVLSAFKIFYFIVPRISEYTIPLAFLFAILLTIGRLIVDNELVAIQSSGISLIKIFSMFLLIGFIFSLFLLFLKSRVIPDTHFRYHTQLKTTYSKNLPALIEPGVFLDDFKDHILYVTDKNNQNLKNIYIYKTNQEEDITEITFAKRGKFVVDKNILKVKLEQGFRDMTNASNATGPYRLNFKRFFMDLPIQKDEETIIKKKPKDMRLEELQKKINTLRKKIPDNNKAEIPFEFLSEFHRRISFSFAPLAFVILGFGVSMIIKHREKSINFIVAALTAGIYYLFFLLGETLTQYHILPPPLAMWLPNIVVTLAGVFLFYKYANFR